jgi:Yip1 domain
VLQNFIDMLTAPSAAFTRLKDQPTFWLPMLVLVVLTISAQAGYLLLNDAGFVKDEIIEQSIGNRDMPAAQREQIEESMRSMSLTTQAAISGAAVFIIVPVILALNVWYLGFISKFLFIQLSFKHWLSLLSWVSVPALLGIGVSWAMLLTDGNGQITQRELQPLSILSLLGSESDSQILRQVNLLQVWSLVLAALGYQQWTKKSLLTSVAITWAPSLIIYGGLALAAL